MTCDPLVSVQTSRLGTNLLNIVVEEVLKYYSVDVLCDKYRYKTCIHILLQ